MRYGGNTSCIEVRHGDDIIILDAGTGLRGLGQTLLTEFKNQPLNLTLLLTHTHWERMGAEAEAMRGRFADGWDSVFVTCFRAYAGAA